MLLIEKYRLCHGSYPKCIIDWFIVDQCLVICTLLMIIVTFNDVCNIVKIISPMTQNIFIIWSTVLVNRTHSLYMLYTGIVSYMDVTVSCTCVCELDYGTGYHQF